MRKRLIFSIYTWPKKCAINPINANSKELPKHTANHEFKETQKKPNFKNEM